MTNRFESIDHLGGYLNQDWDLDYSNAREALPEYIEDLRNRPNARTEIQSFIGLPVSELTAYWHQVADVCYRPSLDGFQDRDGDVGIRDFLDLVLRRLPEAGNPSRL